MSTPFSGVLLSRRALVVAAFLAAALAVAGTGQRAAASDDVALNFVQDLGGQAVAVLRDHESSTFEEREAAFRAILVKAFDVPTVSRFVLGRHWRTASEQQRADYLDIFIDFIARVYASRFDSYGGETLNAYQSIDDESGDTIVRTRIERPGGDKPVHVDFRVREKNGDPRVIDVVVEGISMLHTHRVEFSSVINRKGIDGLLSDLRARVEAPLEETAN